MDDNLIDTERKLEVQIVYLRSVCISLQLVHFTSKVYPSAFICVAGHLKND